jgi:hypothetical protein
VIFHPSSFPKAQDRVPVPSVQILAHCKCNAKIIINRKRYFIAIKKAGTINLVYHVSKIIIQFGKNVYVCHVTLAMTNDHCKRTERHEIEELYVHHLPR